MATLRTGQQVPVFFDWYSAKKTGYLSRSAWKSDGLIVSLETVPSGIVVLEHGNVANCNGLHEPVLDVEAKKEDWVVVATKYYDVFTKEQAVPKLTKRKKKKEPGREGSLMTEECSQVLAKQRKNATQSETDKDSVNRIRSYVPEGLLDLDYKHRDGVWYLLNLIYWKHLEQRLRWDETVYLKWDYLKANIPNWTSVWDYCQRNGIVERLGGYAVGIHSYGYRTNLPYRDQTHRLVTFDHKVLAKQLRKATNRYWSRPVLRYLRDQLDRISVDMEQFESRFRIHPNKHYYLAHLQTISDKQIRFTQDDFSGRLHTNVTNLYKPLRSLLRVDGLDAPLGEIDIKNSQPLFLGLAAKKRGVIDEGYLQHCQNGTIYEYLADRVGMLRVSAKAEFIKMLYAKNGFRSPIKSVFESDFPFIAQLAHKLKVKDHLRLSRQMQEAERKFIIDTVVARLIKERQGMFITTIHDAILAKADECQFVTDVMLEEFGKLGMSPNLNWEQLRITL